MVDELPSESVKASRSSSGKWILLAVVAGISLAVAPFLILRLLDSWNEPNRRALCSSNLRQIGLGIAMYSESQLVYPQAAITDDEGRPMHSWRIVLLPIIGGEIFADIYNAYRFDEPWDGPHNRRLAEQAPSIYRCPSDDSPPGDTSYLAVVGDETMWPAQGAVSRFQFGDGPGNTILIVEASGFGVNWLEPRDMPLDVAARGINVVGKAGIRGNHRDGANFLFGDLRILRLPDDTPPSLLRALFTRHGREHGDKLFFEPDKDIEYWRAENGQN